MIFVTVGNARNSFLRLVEAADQVASRLEEEMVLQSGHTPFQARHARQIPFLDLPAYDSTIRSARIVVAHAGTGTILTAFQSGKPVIVMPRLKKFHEHVNDHQLEIAEALSREGWLRVVQDAQELWDALQNPPPIKPSDGRRGPLLDVLEDWINDRFSCDRRSPY